MATYHRLNIQEREEISKGVWAKETFSEIAKRIGRNPSTVTREIRNNVKRRMHSYKAVKAQIRADEKKNKGRKKKIDNNERLKEYIHEKLGLEWSPEEIGHRLSWRYGNENIA